MSNELQHCRIDRLPPQVMLEFVAYPSAGRNDDALWPQGPGAVRRDARQQPLLLHFAPGRWLVPDPSAETRALLEHAADGGNGDVVDVTGKWEALMLTGPGAGRLLACDVAVEEVLKDRECAAISLFDAPATVARASGGYAIWVQSSYLTDCIACLERFRASLESHD